MTMIKAKNMSDKRHKSESVLSECLYAEEFLAGALSKVGAISQF